MSTMDVTAVLKKVEKKKKLKAKDEKVVASTDSPKKKVKKSTESGDKKKKKSKKKTDPTGGAVGSPGLNLFDALGLGIFSKINDGISQFTEELGEQMRSIVITNETPREHLENSPTCECFENVLLYADELISIFENLKHNEETGMIFAERIEHVINLFGNTKDGFFVQLERKNEEIKSKFIHELENLFYCACRFFVRYTTEGALYYLLVNNELRDELIKFDLNLTTIINSIITHYDMKQYQTIEQKHQKLPLQRVIFELLPTFEVFCNIREYIQQTSTSTLNKESVTLYLESHNTTEEEILELLFPCIEHVETELDSKHKKYWKLNRYDHSIAQLQITLKNDAKVTHVLPPLSSFVSSLINLHSAESQDWEQQNEETATPYAEKSLTDLISNHIVWENEQKKPKNMEQMSIELQHEWQLHDVINEKNNLKSVLEETKGWLLIYGPQRSGKTLKTLACLHELANEMIEQHNMHEEVSLVFKSVEEKAPEIKPLKDIVYVNMLHAQSAQDIICRINSQLCLNSTHDAEDAVRVFKDFLDGLKTGSIVIFDNFANVNANSTAACEKSEFPVSEEYYVREEISLDGQGGGEEVQEVVCNGVISGSALHIFLSLYGSTLAQYEHKLCLGLVYSGNDITNVWRQFGKEFGASSMLPTMIEPNEQHKLCISRYFEIGPLSRQQGMFLAETLLPNDYSSLLTAAQGISGRMVDYVTLYDLTNLRVISKLVQGFYVTKNKKLLKEKGLKSVTEDVHVEDNVEVTPHVQHHENQLDLGHEEHKADAPEVAAENATQQGATEGATEGAVEGNENQHQQVQAAQHNEAVTAGIEEHKSEVQTPLTLQDVTSPKTPHTVNKSEKTKKSGSTKKTVAETPKKVISIAETIQNCNSSMLNKLTYNELLCLSCLVTAATTTVHGSAAAAVGAAADTPLSKTESVASPISPPKKDKSTKETKEKRKSTKLTQNVAQIATEPTLTVKLQTNTTAGDAPIGTLLKKYFFQENLAFSLAKSAFSDDKLLFFMAFSGLLNAGFIRYVDGLGYYLPYVFTPLEIALVLPNAGKDLKSDENKNAGVESPTGAQLTKPSRLNFPPIQIDWESQVRNFLLHFAHDLRDVNNHAVRSQYSSLIYYDQHYTYFLYLFDFISHPTAELIASHVKNMTPKKVSKKHNNLPKNAFLRENHLPTLCDQLCYILAGQLKYILNYRHSVETSVQISCGIMCVMRGIFEHDIQCEESEIGGENVENSPVVAAENNDNKPHEHKANEMEPSKPIPAKNEDTHQSSLPAASSPPASSSPPKVTESLLQRMLSTRTASGDREEHHHHHEERKNSQDDDISTITKNSVDFTRQHSNTSSIGGVPLDVIAEAPPNAHNGETHTEHVVQRESSAAAGAAAERPEMTPEWEVPPIDTEEHKADEPPAHSPPSKQMSIVAPSAASPTVTKTRTAATPAATSAAVMSPQSPQDAHARRRFKLYIHSVFDLTSQYLRQPDKYLAQAKYTLKIISENEIFMSKLENYEKIRLFQLQGDILQCKKKMELAVIAYQNAYELLQSTRGENREQQEELRFISVELEYEMQKLTKFVKKDGSSKCIIS